jgi:hypothetical protein
LASEYGSPEDFHAWLHGLEMTLHVRWVLLLHRLIEATRRRKFHAHVWIVGWWDDSFNYSLFATLSERVFDAFPITIISECYLSLIAGLVINILFLSDLNQLLNFLAFLSDSDVDIGHHLHP